MNYSLAKLWPDFSRLVVGDITSPEGLSAAFIAVLLVVVAIFSVLSVVSYHRATKQLRFYRTLIKNMTSELLLEKRRELSNSALKNDVYGRLWREFDESLVHIPLKQRLCNTLDAEHFFNTHTIAKGLTENRLLAAVPGFLTAIGVIGTFVGLQLGLGPLGDLDPSNAKVDELTHGIFGMIGGASIAFMTSVWGVLTSVLFNFFEKLLERNIRGSISSFQNEIDYLYPRITAEQSLSNIEDFTRQSNDRLAELDEKIGNKMQEAMREASGVIGASVSESLNTILGPAISRLVDNASSGSEKALESLLERFMDGVGSAGNAQREMMDNAALEIKNASGGMSEVMQGFAATLETQVANMVNKNTAALTQVNDVVISQLEGQSLRDVERQKELTESVNDFMGGLKSQIATLSAQNGSTMKAVQDVLSRQVEEQQGREIARQKILHDQLKGFQTSQEGVIESIGSVIDVQKEHNGQLLSGLGAVLERFEQLSESHENATGAMRSVSLEMKAGANQLGLLSANLKTAIDQFSGELSLALQGASVVSQSNEKTAELLDRVVEGLGKTGEVINNASSTFNDAASRAESGLKAVDNHFDSLGKSLQLHVSALEKQTADLLSEYAKRVQDQTKDRMDVWNQETSKYIGAMSDAVNTIHSVVEEIDGKMFTRKAGVNS